MLKKAYQQTQLDFPSTPSILKLAAFLQLLSLLGETRVRAQAVEGFFSTACQQRQNATPAGLPTATS
jgi:hypothetical protein